MERRYQVFVSSTFQDLQAERQEVMQALLELDCIPAGMELFPAANDDQWTLIKRVIDDCDYYIVIVGGRYGSIGPQGFSYTEMEYRYALEVGKPVIAFLHKSPGKIQVSFSEPSEEGKQKLSAFRELIQQRMVRFWETPSELGSQVSRSLVKLIKTNPAVGWVRGDNVADESAAQESLRLRRRIEDLERTLRSGSAPADTDQLAQGEDVFRIRYESRYYNPSSGVEHTQLECYVTWNRIFSVLAPVLMDEATEDDLRKALRDVVRGIEQQRIKEALEDVFDPAVVVSESDFQSVKLQLHALGLMAKSTKQRSLRDTAVYWSLTPSGRLR